MRITRIFQSMTMVVLAALLLVAPGRLWAGTIEVEINPNPQDLFCGEKKAGSLEVTNYFKRENFQGPLEDFLSSGAVMEAIFTPDPKFCPPGQSIGNLRWVNAITAGVNTIAPPPYLDPFNRDDGLPFYWTEAENADPILGQGGTRFLDTPSQPNSLAANSVSFETGLFCVDLVTKSMSFLGGFRWGYSRDDSDADGERDDITLNAFAWLAGISPVMKGLIENWDASPNKPFAGDGTPDGWKISEDCECACIPEPSSILMAVSGGIGLLIVVRRRTKLRQTC